MIEIKPGQKSKYGILIKLAAALANSPRYSILGHIVMDPKTIKPDEVEGTYHIRMSHELADIIARQLAGLYRELKEDAETTPQ